MKKLIFALCCLSFHAYADVQEVSELSDSELNKKLISSVKEFEIKNTISESAQFKECKDKAKITSGKPADAAAAQAAVDCFKQKIGTGKSAEDLGKLSDALGLESYGLVNSKNTKAITAYLADQMYEKLTGVNPNEQDARKKLQDMKFGKKKLIDQKIFIQLYKMQLIKNSLFEVSRFCFENFRYLPSYEVDKNSSFAKHWEGVDVKSLTTGQVTDVGTKPMGSFSDVKSTQQIYQSIFDDLGVGTNNFAIVQSFFEGCSAQIKPLCDEFKKTVSAPSGQEKDLGESKSGKGANACLTVDRIQKLRKAIADSKKVADEFDRMDSSTFRLKLANLNTFDLAQETGELSADNLTNFASGDLLKGKVIDDATEKKMEDCSKNASGADCDAFVIVDDSRAKLESDTDLQYRLRREVELERVRSLVKGDQQKLMDYLKDNGYLDMAKDLEAGNLQKENIEEEIGKVFEAKRLAAINEIKSKLGSRQISESDASKNGVKEAAIKENITATKEEKARMAQLVFFNNIVTGYLTLKKGTENLGRNVNVLKKEKQTLTSNQVSLDPTLFEGLKDGEGGAKGSLFENAEFLDTILGAPSTSNGGGQAAN